MNIFFAGSIRGGREKQPQYAFITNTLKKYGDVYSQFVHDGALSDFGETRLSDAEIHSRELEALEKADIIVAEVTTPSLGVGYLIAHATASKKRAIALYQGEDTLKLSAMITGNPLVEVHTYQSVEDIENIIESEFSKPA
jgi:hypothetical protein